MKTRNQNLLGVVVTLVVAGLSILNPGLADEMAFQIDKKSSPQVATSNPCETMDLDQRLEIRTCLSYGVESGRLEFPVFIDKAIEFLEFYGVEGERAAVVVLANSDLLGLEETIGLAKIECNESGTSCHCTAWLWNSCREELLSFAQQDSDNTCNERSIQCQRTNLGLSETCSVAC